VSEITEAGMAIEIFFFGKPTFAFAFQMFSANKSLKCQTKKAFA
jgi:hypothetical protein